jgi:hypothetical protein
MLAQLRPPDILHVQGEIPQLSELPAPWGPKPYEATEEDAANAPAQFPEGFLPLKDMAGPAVA